MRSDPRPNRADTPEVGCIRTACVDKAVTRERRLQGRGPVLLLLIGILAGLHDDLDAPIGGAARR